MSLEEDWPFSRRKPTVMCANASWSKLTSGCRCGNSSHTRSVSWRRRIRSAYVPTIRGESFRDRWFDCLFIWKSNLGDLRSSREARNVDGLVSSGCPPAPYSSNSEQRWFCDMVCQMLGPESSLPFRRNKSRGLVDHRTKPPCGGTRALWVQTQGNRGAIYQKILHVQI